jgi:hypothetical protein
MQEIKVTRCIECPFIDYNYFNNKYFCGKDNNIAEFDYIDSFILPNNCPIKGETITFKIGENE